jgi:hypothetical protein
MYLYPCQIASVYAGVLMKIHVEIREQDGTFYATSEQVPGFLLCSRDQQALSADILPAMKLLLSVREQNQKRPAKKAGSAARLVERREFAFAA